MVLASPKGEKLSSLIIHELHACTLQYTRLIPDSERTILVLGHVLSCSLSKLHDKTSLGGWGGCQILPTVDTTHDATVRIF